MVACPRIAVYLKKPSIDQGYGSGHHGTLLMGSNEPSLETPLIWDDVPQSDRPSQTSPPYYTSGKP